MQRQYKQYVFDYLYSLSFYDLVIENPKRRLTTRVFLHKFSNKWWSSVSKPIIYSRKNLIHIIKAWIHIVPIAYITIRFILWHEPPKLVFYDVNIRHDAISHFFVCNNLRIFKSTIRTIWKHYFFKPELKGFFHFAHIFPFVHIKGS